MTDKTAKIDMDTTQTVIVRLVRQGASTPVSPSATPGPPAGEKKAAGGGSATPDPTGAPPGPTATGQVVVKEVPVTVEVPVTRIVEKQVARTVVVVATPAPQPAPRSTGRGGTGPDLVIEDVTTQPANPAPGDTVIFDVRVRNQGLGKASGFRTELTNSPNYTRTSSCTVGAYIRDLGPGVDETVRITAKVERGKSYWLVVDTCDRVPETDEGNQAFRIEISLADLVIDRVISRPANPAPGDTVIFDVRVRNQGLGNAHGFRTELTNSPNYTRTSSCTVGAYIRDLGPGVDETVRITAKVERGKSYWLVVDTCDRVPETDVGNNSSQFGQVR